MQSCMPIEELMLCCVFFSIIRIITILFYLALTHLPKEALSWYGKLTWESAHAWNLIILC